MNLKPIETAPQGRYILLFGKSGYIGVYWRCCVGKYNTAKGRWEDHAGDAVTSSGEVPTHWAELPKEPDNGGT